MRNIAQRLQAIWIVFFLDEPIARERHLRSYANTNPLQDYVNEGQALFRECLENISQEVVFKFLNVIVQIKKPAEEKKETAKPKEEDVLDVESKDKE